MYIEKIAIKNFRNIENLEINLNRNINIFIGNNAQGKTSILESIYVLALTKSSKNLEETNLIKKDCEISKITGEILKKNKKTKYEILLKNNEKILKINNNIEKKIQNYVSNINVIMFSPDDLDIIKKSPINRRNLLNIELCQLFQNYMKVLNEYNKLLKIRNEYIRKNSEKIDNNYLDIVTDKLIDRSIIIMDYRKKYIENININLSKIYKKIMKKGLLRLEYKSSLQENDKEKIKKIYKDNLFYELNKKMTCFGPHRDDLEFYIDDIELKEYGSQGQQRVAILAFKLSEILLFKEIKKNYPIVLLDDIFSELDIEKRNNLIKFIRSNIQFVITTTDIENISKDIVEKANIYKIKQGKITK